ncbi:MAG: O-methyltransferase [Firmicutes bacterium]|nr:O-methyltransferase [Bacillota bacterium]
MNVENLLQDQAGPCQQMEKGDGLTLEYLGQFTLLQSSACFKLGRDSVLLSRFATLKRGWRVCDLGCGVGSLLLLLSERERELVRFGIEIDAAAADLARRNLAENGLEGDIRTGDLRERDLLPSDGFQLVISNPPYFRGGSCGPAGVSPWCSGRNAFRSCLPPWQRQSLPLNGFSFSAITGINLLTPSCWSR